MPSYEVRCSGILCRRTKSHGSFAALPCYEVCCDGIENEVRCSGILCRRTKSAALLRKPLRSSGMCVITEQSSARNEVPSVCCIMPCVTKYGLCGTMYFGPSFRRSMVLLRQFCCAEFMVRCSRPEFMLLLRNKLKKQSPGFCCISSAILQFCWAMLHQFRSTKSALQSSSGIECRRTWSLSILILEFWFVAKMISAAACGTFR